MSALKSTTQLGRLEHWTELIENSKEPIGFENESIKLINGYQPFDEWCKENGKDDLLAEWIPENGKKPNEISFHSAYSAKWKCKTCGREWKAVVRDRTLKNEGCGKCKHGTHTSFPESAVYFYVKRYLPDAIQDYTCNWLGKKHLDVYLESSSVAIEYDGAAWHRDIKKDIEKDEICCNNGVKLFRVRESGCPEIKSTSTVIDVNKDTLNSYINLESSIHNLLSLLLNDAETERVVDINISRDYDRIFEMCEYKKGKASFAAMRPDLVCEWDYEQNGVLRPENFTECSGVAVWFICHRCGKRWKTEICNRKHCGCPSCGNKEGKRKHDIAKLKNARQYQTLKMVSIELKTMSEKDKMNFKVINLKITNPEILKYWSPENNASPLEFTKGSNYSVLWKCPKCGTTFKKSIRLFIKNPICNSCMLSEGSAYLNNLSRAQQSSRLKKGISLGTAVPNITKYWSNKNTLSPFDILSKSNKYVYLICPDCGETFKRKPSKITESNKNKFPQINFACPICNGRKLRKGFNDLKTKYPKFAKMFSNSNTDSASNVLPSYSSKSYKWICPYCGNEFNGTAKDIINGKIGCTSCRNERTKNALKHYHFAHTLRQNNHGNRLLKYIE